MNKKTIEANAINNVFNDNVTIICQVSSQKNIFSTTIILKIASKDSPSSPSQQQDIKNKMNEGKCQYTLSRNEVTMVPNDICKIASSVQSSLSSSLIGILHGKPSLRCRYSGSTSLCCDVINKTSNYSTKSCGSSVIFHNNCDDPSIRSAMETNEKFSATTILCFKVHSDLQTDKQQCDLNFLI